MAIEICRSNSRKTAGWVAGGHFGSRRSCATACRAPSATIEHLKLPPT